MADKTLIEWSDSTWNVITGCSVVSAGCKNCYAMKLAGTRLQHHPSRAGLTIDTSNGPVWNGEVRFNREWLDQPLKWKRPRMIFVCAHGDLFHESVPDEWIDQVFAVMALASHHTFQVLTKRAERMRRYMIRVAGGRHIWTAGQDITMPRGQHKPDSRWPLSNVWLGVSVENQEAADERIPLLLQTPAAVRWISAEPLLGPVDLRSHFSGYCPEHDFSGGFCVQRHHEGVQNIHWVVAGGESGANARPMHPDWTRSLLDQCKKAGVAFLFKQWGEWAPTQAEPIRGQYTGGGLFLLPNGQRGCQGDWWDGKAAAIDKVGKKAAGRILDGRTWDEYPKAGST